MKTTRLTTTLTAVAACLALPAAAHAGTAGIADLQQQDGSTVRALLFVADPGERNSTGLAYSNGSVTFYDTLAGGVQAGDGCEQIVTAGSRDVRCPTDGVQVAVLALGDGDDKQSVPNLDRKQEPCPIPLYVDAGDGNDTIVTCRDADSTVELGNGDDELWVGTTASVDASLGAGNDSVASFSGAMFGQKGTFDAGPGDDTMIGTTAQEVFKGGDGRDRVEFPYNKVDANLDGQAGDSPEGDHVHGDVEELASSVAGSVISGNDGPNALVSGGPGVTVRGLGGDDTLLGSDYGEQLEGGAGNDRITGGFGDDVLDGGAGMDSIEGDRQVDDGFAAGNDTIRARDGEADRVACNIGADVAVIDAKDAADACEQVDRADVAGPGGQPGEQVVTPDAGPKTPDAGASLTIAALPKAKLRVALRRGLQVRFTAPGAGTVTGELRKGGKVVARGKVVAAGAGPATMTLRFTAAGRKRLRTAKRASLTLTLRAGGTVAKRTVKLA